MKYTIFLRTVIQLKDIFSIGLDLIHGTKTLSLVKTVGFPGGEYLFVGVIDGHYEKLYVEKCFVPSVWIIISSL
jgi:hypothetical protein